MQFCEMLKFTTNFIKSAVIKKNSLNYLKCKKTTKQYYLLTKFFQFWSVKNLGAMLNVFLYFNASKSDYIYY